MIIPLRHIIVLTLLTQFIVGSSLSAQNLIPDPGFEKRVDTECRTPIQAFKYLEYWYLLDATPDLFVGGCSFNELDFGFWHEDTEPFEGSNYTGIWSRWNSNSTYFSEGLATTLIEPLEAGTYYFEIAIKNQGELQGFDDSIALCALFPDKHIDLYLSTDSILVENNFSNGTASTTAPMVASLESEDIKSNEAGDWVLVSTCFEALGGERFFGLIMPLGTFGDLPPCASTAGSGVFRSFYYNLDAASIIPLPNELLAETVVCDNQAFDVTITDLFEFSLLEGAEFVWEDGFIGDFRALNEIRTYSIDAIVNCGSIPLKLNVLPENCESPIHIPNIFSPNDDGFNDEFKAFTDNQGKITNFKMSIFDRWGNFIFEGNGIDNGWNGEKNGEKLPQGIYSYIISFETPESVIQKENLETGTVMLLR